MCKVVLALFATLMFAPAILAQQPAWADKLFGGDTVHDFGTVHAGAGLKYSFKMTNIYKVPLEITEVKVSCGCVRAEASTKALQPGETATLNINMDGRMFVGTKTVKVFVKVGPQYTSTATLTVSAISRGDIIFTPTEIDFGNLHRGETPNKAIDVEYVGGKADWRVIEVVKNSAAPFELKVEELPRPLNGPQCRGYRIVATIKADPTAGSFKQEVVLKTNDPAAPMVNFNILGNMQAGLAVSPGTIVVRDLKVGESQTKKVFVKASRPFRILAIDGQGDGITGADSDRQDTTLVLTVNVNPTKAGDLRRRC